MKPENQSGTIERQLSQQMSVFMADYSLIKSICHITHIEYTDHTSHLLSCYSFSLVTSTQMSTFSRKDQPDMVFKTAKNDYLQTVTWSTE